MAVRIDLRTLWKPLILFARFKVEPARKALKFKGYALLLSQTVVGSFPIVRSIFPKSQGQVRQSPCGVRGAVRDVTPSV